MNQSYVLSKGLVVHGASEVVFIHLIRLDHLSTIPLSTTHTCRAHILSLLPCRDLLLFRLLPQWFYSLVKSLSS